MYLTRWTLLIIRSIGLFLLGAVYVPQAMAGEAVGEQDRADRSQRHRLQHHELLCSRCRPAN